MTARDMGIVALAATLALAGCSAQTEVTRPARMRCVMLKRDALEATSKLLRENGYQIRITSFELGVIQADRSAAQVTQRWVIRYSSDSMYLRPSRIVATGEASPVTTDLDLRELSAGDAEWVLPIADAVAGLCGIVVPGRQGKESE